MPATHANPARRLRLAAALILVASLLGAALVLVIADSQAGSNADATSAAALGPVQVASEMQQLERIGGKGAVVTFKFQHWFESLWQGRQLALTLVLLGAALAGLCLHLARLADDGPP